KYDSFTQRDYYRFFAFFNNTPKETYQRTKGSAALDFGGPEMEMPGEPQAEAQRKQLAARREQLERHIDQCLEDESSGLVAWHADMRGAERAERPKLPQTIRKILAIAPAKRSKNQQSVLRTYVIGVLPE